MKALKYTIFTLLFGGALTSCNFLDKEPYQLTLSDYFNTADEANSFLTGIYRVRSVYVLWSRLYVSCGR